MREGDKRLMIVKRVLHRALWTACESMLGFMTVGSTIQSVDWKTAVSVTALAVLISVFKSLLVGMPEVDDEEE